MGFVRSSGEMFPNAASCVILVVLLAMVIGQSVPPAPPPPSPSAFKTVKLPSSSFDPEEEPKSIDEDVTSVLFRVKSTAPASKRQLPDICNGCEEIAEELRVEVVTYLNIPLDAVEHSECSGCTWKARA